MSKATEISWISFKKSIYLPFVILWVLRLIDLMILSNDDAPTQSSIGFYIFVNLGLDTVLSMTQTKSLNKQ